MLKSGGESSIAGTGSSDSAANNGVTIEDDGSLKLKFDGYAITLIVVFVVQIAFCIGICCYTNMQVGNAKKETVKQQAEFYQFLYQFHK